MSLPVAIVDGPSEVRERTQLVALRTVTPTAEEAVKVKLWTALMTDPAGSGTMAVDGSTTAVEFAIRAEVAKQIAITELRLVFHSRRMNITSNEARRFGPVGGGGLTNGLELYAEQDGTRTDLFLSAVTVLGDFYRYQDSFVNDLNAISAGVDYYMARLILAEPVRLCQGSRDKLAINVRDDLTGIVLFETQVYGTQIDVG